MKKNIIIVTVFSIFSFTKQQLYAQDNQTNIQLISAANHEAVECLVTLYNKGGVARPFPKWTTTISCNLKDCSGIHCQPHDPFHAEDTYDCSSIIYLKIIDPEKWQDYLQHKKKYDEDQKNRPPQSPENIGLNKTTNSKNAFN